MLVEDDPAILGLLETLLRRALLDVAQSTNSAEAALALLVAGTFDLVVLDDRLDGPTRGLDIVPMIRELSPRTKIVLFSATAALDGTDVDAALSKFDVIRLVPTIRSLLHISADRTETNLGRRLRI